MRHRHESFFSSSPCGFNVHQDGGSLWRAILILGESLGFRYFAKSLSFQRSNLWLQRLRKAPTLIYPGLSVFVVAEKPRKESQNLQDWWTIHSRPPDLTGPFQCTQFYMPRSTASSVICSSFLIAPLSSHFSCHPRTSPSRKMTHREQVMLSILRLLPWFFFPSFFWANRKQLWSLSLHLCSGIYSLFASRENPLYWLSPLFSLPLLICFANAFTGLEI